MKVIDSISGQLEAPQWISIGERLMRGIMKLRKASNTDTCGYSTIFSSNYVLGVYYNECTINNSLEKMKEYSIKHM